MTSRPTSVLAGCGVPRCHCRGGGCAGVCAMQLLLFDWVLYKLLWNAKELSTHGNHDVHEGVSGGGDGTCWYVHFDLSIYITCT
mgnify:CR=1 FL=1